MKTWIMIVMGALAAGCGGGASLGGDGSHEDGIVDVAGEEAAEVLDVPGDPDAPVDADAPDEDLPPDGECCAPPMVLDRGTGICVDPTGLNTDCEASADVCHFGQMCMMVWGEGPIGRFCHIPCNAYASRLCPEGYVCDPVRCCDIPNNDCVQDTCEPPLLMNPWAGLCASPEGIGMDCSITESCNAGQDCVRYQGIDGLDRFSCEIVCGRDDAGHRVCPNGYACTDFDDGPENVCRPMEGLRECTDPDAQTCGFPEKFTDVTRDFVCRGCYGVHFCVAEGELDSFRTNFPEGALDCGAPGHPCAEGQVLCTFPFRSGVNDCPDGERPSDFYWSTVCLAARLDAVRSVRCYYLE